MKESVKQHPLIKPKILMIGHLYPPARASGARLLRELARSFARDGWEVSVLTTGKLRGYDSDGAVRVQRLKIPEEKFTVLTAFLLLFRFFFAGLFQRRVDLIITVSDPPLLVIIGTWLSKLRGIPHIHWCHDVYPDLLPVIGIRCPRWIYKRIYTLSRWAMNRTSRLVVVGRCMARHLSQTGVDSQKITLIPNWPELAMNPHIKTEEINSTGINAALLANISPPPIEQTRKFRVLYTGTIGYAHPIDTILDAATILESTHPEIEFIFICEESGQSLVTVEKIQRGLNNVRILPFQPVSRLRDIMESGDLHLLSMKHEAAGLMVPAKFYASLSAARPCLLIGPDACEIARVITDYHLGAVIPQKSAQLLAQTIVDYRLREDLWFIAHDGAIKAAAAYTAEDMIRLWIKKARECCDPPVPK